MAAAAYAALREKVPGLPELPTTEELSAGLTIADVYLKEPLWDDDTGFHEEWDAVRSHLSAKRFEMKKTGKDLTKAIALDRFAETSLENLTRQLPVFVRSKIRTSFMTLRMPIDRWIELVRIAEELLAELIAAQEPPAEKPAAASEATEAPQAPPPPSAPRAD